MQHLPLPIHATRSNLTKLGRHWHASGILLAGLVLSAPAYAQFGGGGGGGGGGQGGMGGMRPMGGPGQSAGPAGADKKEDDGPAEAAPETRAQEPATQPMPAWPGQKEKTLQFLEIHGYFRGRAYLFNNFNLGINDSTGAPGPSWFVPYTEYNATGNPASPGNSASCAARDGNVCRTDNLTSADIRLRIEPTLNVSEQIRIKSQIDIFDNYVMGSSPEGYYLNGLSAAPGASLSFYNRTASPFQSGINSFSDAIRVKRVWAEVKTPIGELRAGRMPQNWGMGMLFNSGDCLDCDYGSSVDRVMFMAKAWNHFFAFMWDWVASGPTTALYMPYQTTGQAYNADTLDDISQWGIALGRQDKPEEIRERLDRGQTVFNYGGYFLYRQQDWDLIANPGQGTGGVLNKVSTQLDLAANITPRHAWAVISDIWLRLNWKKLNLELEAAIIGGKIGVVNDLSSQLINAKSGYTLLQWGGVFRGDYSLLRGDSLHIGLEVGSASGDSAEDSLARINFRKANRFYPDGSTVGRFQFEPDFHVDLILFRQILGTVNNATYFKPSIAYDVTSYLSGRLDLIYSIANNFVAYPGNGTNLGVEIDAAIMYRNEREGFYAGIFYGVLFPLEALNIPGSIYGSQFNKSADTAQTFQGKMFIKF